MKPIMMIVHERVAGILRSDGTHLGISPCFASLTHLINGGTPHPEMIPWGKQSFGSANQLSIFSYPWKHSLHNPHDCPLLLEAAGSTTRDHPMMHQFINCWRPSTMASLDQSSGINHSCAPSMGIKSFEKSICPLELEIVETGKSSKSCVESTHCMMIQIAVLVSECKSFIFGSLFVGLTCSTWGENNSYNVQHYDLQAVNLFCIQSVDVHGYLCKFQARPILFEHSLLAFVSVGLAAMYKNLRLFDAVKLSNHK